MEKLGQLCGHWLCSFDCILDSCCRRHFLNEDAVTEYLLSVLSFATGVLEKGAPLKLVGFELCFDGDDDDDSWCDGGIGDEEGVEQSCARLVGRLMAVPSVESVTIEGCEGVLLWRMDWWDSPVSTPTDGTVVGPI